MITERDKKIIEHIRQYKFITTRQGGIFFTNPSAIDGYETIRKRLRKLYTQGVLITRTEKLKRYRSAYDNQVVYYIGKNAPNPIDVKVMDIIANLVRLGFNIYNFETNKTWDECPKVADAFIFGEYNDCRRAFIVEICLDNDRNIVSAYNNLYKSGKLRREWTVTPTILLIGYQKTENTTLPVKYLDYDLTNLQDILGERAIRAI